MEEKKKYKAPEMEDKGRILEDSGAAYGVSGKNYVHKKNRSCPNQVTLDAIRQAEEGECILCGSFEDYLRETGQCATN